MDELDLKVIALSSLRARKIIGNKSIISNEFCIKGTRNRADIAILGKKFIGIEIKSPKDSLFRLPLQSESYEKYFDKSILVISEKHLSLYTDNGISHFDLWVVDWKGDVSIVHSNDYRKADYAGLLSQSESRSYDELSSEEKFRLIFEKKFSHTSKKFWESIYGRKIKREDLLHLSRFHKERSKINEKKKMKENFWQAWNEEIRGLAV
ncbi:sce7726 family protein [Gluconobacter cerinus]|uniref:sce7726 family protein n=1 Tax=Gluconobacter cerinus TaxID=38307 RepID=UPI001B8AE8A8|nr:sce7726 family protein [Gluconobacter cerinus]MBS1037764.1 sce7726 family protein [Gluconobacter cerinus]